MNERDRRENKSILRQFRHIKHTGDERLFFDKTVWRRWRWIHCVCCLHPNDMCFNDCPSFDDWRCLLSEFFTWNFFENGKICWLLIIVFIAVMHITVSLFCHDHNARFGPPKSRSERIRWKLILMHVISTQVLNGKSSCIRLKWLIGWLICAILGSMTDYCDKWMRNLCWYE